MRIVIGALCLSIYIFIGYLLYRFFIKLEYNNYNLFEGDALGPVLLWPILLLIFIILAIVYYTRFLIAKIYVGVFKKK